MVSGKQYDIEEYEKKVGFSANVFENMKNLRLLDIRGRFTSSEPMFFPDNLRWLSWSRYPFSSLSMTDMSKLVHLQVVGGTIKQFWNGQKIVPNLKILKLQELDYLTAFPDVSGAPNIERLNVCECKNLVEFHKSLGSHERISVLKVSGCERLKRLPSRFEMESLRSLMVNRCSSLERFPDVSPCMVKLSYLELDCCSSIEGLLSSLGYLSSLEIMYLDRDRDERFWKVNTPMCKEYPEKNGCRENLVEDDTMALESLPKFISVNTPIESRSLIILSLCGRPMESEVFLKNLRSFSSLIELDLSGNNNLIQLPASISYLSFLEYLWLNECHQLQILHGLPSSIHRLEANNCYSLEKIDDLSEEYDCLRKISFINCHKLFKDEDSIRYLEKIFQQQSFLNWIQQRRVIYLGISIFIPGNKIPRWFKEELKGSTIRVMIPPKCNNEQIKGIVICAVFPPAEWQSTYDHPWVDCYFKKDGVCSPKKEFDCVNNASPTAGDKGSTWIFYKSCRFIRGFEREESSGGGVLNIQVHVFIGPKPVRCAAHLIYEEDVE